jgi:hypothetical protein
MRGPTLLPLQRDFRSEHLHLPSWAPHMSHTDILILTSAFPQRGSSTFPLLILKGA